MKTNRSSKRSKARKDGAAAIATAILKLADAKEMITTIENGGRSFGVETSAMCARLVLQEAGAELERALLGLDLLRLNVPYFMDDDEFEAGRKEASHG
jgi:hypothetical protein